MALSRARLRLTASNGENAIWETPLNAAASPPCLDTLLRYMHQLDPNGPRVEAVQYEDDEGDLVTVTNDEEVAEMTRYAAVLESEGVYDPLLVYPKVPSSLKNVHDLTLALEQPITSNNNDLNVLRPSPSHCQKQSARQPSADLGHILSQGQVSFGHLEYTRPLGQGSGGMVYQAVHKATGRPLAVKKIWLESPDNDTQKQIMSELQTLHQCNSDRIVDFYGAFFRENCIHICMEMMDGGSLDHYGALPELVLRGVAVPVIEGLNYLWRSLKILHRDVKPSNVLVNFAGDVKLCDFGVSIQLARSIAKSFVGTNAYMSPERILGGEYGIAAEIWSLGLSLLEMSLGRFPFPRPMDASFSSSSSAPLSFMRIILDGQPDFPADASPAFLDLVRGSLERDPGRRTSAADFSEHPFFRAEPLEEGARKEVVRRWLAVAVAR